MYFNKTKARCLSFILLCLLLGAGHGKDYQIQKLKQTITLDGLLEEDVWQSATPISLSYQTEPAENTTAQVKTEAKIFQDGEFLYIGFSALDDNVKQIQASYRNRDDIKSEDRVGVRIDTFNDQRRSYNFFVNPLGIQMDSIEDDILDREDISWNSIWFSAAQINKNGYTVEIKIPFKVFQFPDSKDDTSWAIDFVRLVPRDYNYRFASAKVDRDINCNICQFDKVSGFEGLNVGKNLELIPYVVGQKTEQKDLPLNNEWQSNGFDSEAGLDLQWSINDSSILNLTVNPDFTQVESDEAQIDINNQFSLFFVENRPFFLEGADYFNTPLNIFYSRNIANPDFGAKYSGKYDNATLGVMLARDEQTQIIIPGSQGSALVELEKESDAAAFRYGYDISENSIIGVSMTHRSSDDYSNTLLSIDGKYQFTDTDVFRYQVIHTETDNPDEVVGYFGLAKEQSGGAYRLNYSHNDRDWSYFVSHNVFDEDFRADLGFLTRSGYRKSVAGAARRWYGEENDYFSKIEISGDLDTTYQYDGQRLESEAELRLRFNGASQSAIDFYLGSRETYFDNSWFEQDFYELSYSFRPLTNLGFGFLWGQSDAIDFSNSRAGEITEYIFESDWQINKHLNLELSAVNRVFDLPEAELFDALIGNLKLVYQFDEKSFVRFLLRYNDTNFHSDPNVRQNLSLVKNTNIGRQLLYAYKFDAKSVFYLGYSDRLLENDELLSLEKDQRSLFAKFSYAFQL